MNNGYIHGILCATEEQLHSVIVDWNLALGKLEVTFVAEHGGGRPDVLMELSAEQRLTMLSTLGFRVRRRWEVDNSVSGDGSDVQRWVDLYGGISVNLSVGWVSAGGRT